MPLNSGVNKQILRSHSINHSWLNSRCLAAEAPRLRGLGVVDVVSPGPCSSRFEFSKLIVVSFGDKFLIGVRRAGERPALYFGESRTFHLFVLIHSLLYSGLSSLVDRLACVVQTIFKITGRAVIDHL